MSSSMSNSSARLPCRRPLRHPTQEEPSSTTTTDKPEQRPKLRRQHPEIYETVSRLEESKDVVDFIEAASDFMAAYQTCWRDILDAARSVNLPDFKALEGYQATGTTACKNSIKGCREARPRSDPALTATLDVLRRERATLKDHYGVVMSAVCKDKPLPGVPNNKTDEDINKHLFNMRSDVHGDARPNAPVTTPTDSSHQYRAKAVSGHAKADSISTSSTLTASSTDPSVSSHSSHTKSSSVSSTATVHTDFHAVLPLELVFNSLFEEQQELKHQRQAEGSVEESEKPSGSLHRLKQKLVNSTLSLPGLSNKSGGKPSKSPVQLARRPARAGHPGVDGGDEDLDGFQEANRETFYGYAGFQDHQVKRRNSDLAPHSVVLGSGGVVQMATVQGLLCVATSSDHRDDHHLRSILLNDFRKFASPVDLVQFMRQRYRKNYTYQLRVANLLLLWIHSHWQPQDMTAFDEIVKFLEKMEKDEIVSSTVLANIRCALDHPRILTNSPSRFIISVNAVKPFAPMDILAIQCDYRWCIAVQVTFTASELYRRVDKSLLIRYWMADKAGKQQMAQESADNWKLMEVLAIPAFEEALAKWVSYTITQGDGVTARAQLIGFWLDIAEYCWEMCNFSSASRIYCGVAASYITSMRETVLRVDEQYKHIYHALEWRLSSVKNYAEYRSALKSARDQKKFFVPLSDCLVHDISMGMENHKLAEAQKQAAAQKKAATPGAKLESNLILIRKTPVDTTNMLDLSYTHLESVKQVYECLASVESYGFAKWDGNWQKWFMTHLLRFGDLSCHYPVYETQLIEAARREPRSSNGLDSAGRPLPQCEAPKLWNYVLDKNAYVTFRIPDNHHGAGAKVGRRTSIVRKAKSAARSIRESMNGAMRDNRR